MRRRLLLLRHAKAEASRPGASDRERTLTERGRANARKLGAYLLRHGLVPDSALVSPSARTRETWDLLSAGLAKAPAVRFEEQLYNAAADAVVRAIMGADRAATSLLVIGHNPGLHEAALTLVAAGDIEARQRLNAHFPTSALAVIELAVPDWSGVHADGGRLEHFVEPRSLEAATD